jgi:hypothetical protein
LRIQSEIRQTEKRTEMEIFMRTRKIVLKGEKEIKISKRVYGGL